MLPGEGDQVRLLARAAGADGTDPGDPEDPRDGEPVPDWKQDITDRATGLSRLLSERCPTCILRAGDPMHLGADRTAAFIRHVLDAGSYVVCHDTLTYGDFPGYGPAAVKPESSRSSDTRVCDLRRLLISEVCCSAVPV